ncbi:MAG: HipA domain-containing protein [Bacteroidaceae bacterium]|nr:HipA domain-containing protein [Bacteroidaceae bacterium]
MAKCLYCYKELKEGQIDFHPSCARKIFGQSVAPVLPYTRADIGHLAKQIVSRSITVPGVQAKLSLDIQKYSKQESSRFTIVGLWGKYVLKPQTDIYAHLPELEDLTMHMAETAKISTVPHSLIRFADDELCYITKRIDRLEDGSKIPMEDMCQITEHLTENKYKGSYEQIAKALLKFSSAPLLDVALFWEQVLFSWIIGNADMHLKNFSLFQPSLGLNKLTPAYDLVSTALVLPTDNEELALTLNGKKRKIKADDFRKAMSSSGLSEKVIDKMFLRFINCEDKWNGLIDASFLPAEMQEAYKSLVASHLNMLK